MVHSKKITEDAIIFGMVICCACACGFGAHLRRGFVSLSDTEMLYGKCRDTVVHVLKTVGVGGSWKRLFYSLLISHFQELLRCVFKNYSWKGERRPWSPYPLAHHDRQVFSLLCNQVVCHSVARQPFCILFFIMDLFVGWCWCWFELVGAGFLWEKNTVGWLVWAGWN